MSHYLDIFQIENKLYQCINIIYLKVGNLSCHSKRNYKQLSFKKSSVSVRYWVSVIYACLWGEKIETEEKLVLTPSFCSLLRLNFPYSLLRGFPSGSAAKNLPAM